MFGPIAPTPYDLQFSLFGIPVRVLPWFWLMAAILGWSTLDNGLAALLLWVFAVFLSILVHEFGHALTARAFGYPPQVLLYQFGGLALYSPTQQYTLWRSILITAAGPFSGLALCGLAYAITVGLRIVELSRGDFKVPLGLEYFLAYLVLANLFWSILNLLPVLPLDGGQICRDLLLLATPRNGLRIALIVSVVVGGAVTVYGFTSGQFFLAIMFGSMTAGSMQELQRRRM